MFIAGNCWPRISIRAAELTFVNEHNLATEFCWTRDRGEDRGLVRREGGGGGFCGRILRVRVVFETGRGPVRFRVFSCEICGFLILGKKREGGGEEDKKIREMKRMIVVILTWK